MIPVYLFFGPQGSGKTTQAERLAERLKLPFFDSGNALRDLAKTDSDLGRRVVKIMQSGQLVSNDILRELFVQFIDQKDCRRGFVVDGFPRNLTQVELLEELSTIHQWRVIGILVDISAATTHQRLANRYQIVDGQKVTRPDDEPAIITKRLETFDRETRPVLDHLESRQELIKIDGEPDIETVTTAVNRAIDDGK